MDTVIRALIAICVWFLTFFIGRYYEAIVMKLFWVDKTDECLFATGAVVSLAACVWISII